MEMKDEKTVEVVGDQKMNEPIKTPKELWDDLGSYSTLHGLHFTFNKSSKLRRAFWILLILGSGVFLVNQIYTGWKKVIAFQVVLKYRNEFRDSFDFPAVSICNNNMMKRSRINGTFAQRYLDLLDWEKSSKWPELESGLNYSLDMKSAVFQHGHNISEMLLFDQCRWFGLPCKAYNFTTFSDYRYGLCYTFNSGKNNTKILKSQKTGSSFGLSMVLNAQPEEYYGPYSREGTGFRVIIHDQEEYPSMEKNSWQISPGSSVEMRITRKEVKVPPQLPVTSWKLHSLPAPYPKACREGRGYSQSVCLQTCYTNIVLRNCSCQVLGMLSSEPIDAPWCTPWQMRNCIMGAFSAVNLKNCSCTVECYRVKYDVQTSSMYFPSRTLWETIALKYNVSSDPQEMLGYQAWFRQRYVKLSVFYGELEAEIIKEEPAYEMTDLANDLGGSMGLFLGCSVLTVFEFIDVLVLMCVSHWRRKRQTSSRHFKTSKRKAFENQNCP